jgi:hypothetical protein
MTELLFKKWWNSFKNLFEVCIDWVEYYIDKLRSS